MESNYELRPHPEFGFLQIHPTPTPEEITKFYADEFYAAYPRFNDSALEVQVKDRDWLDARRKEYCDTIAELSGKPVAGQSVLDIGCGWGEALLYFQKQQMECYGFDPAPEAIAYAAKHGLNVEVAGMDKMSVFGDQRFDVVSMLNVLEHLADPVSVVNEIRESVLKPGGILLIDVPNEFNTFQTAGAEVHKLDQWWVAPPGHLNYFSAETLSNLLSGCDYDVKLLEGSFPLEMFLLFGDCYVGNGEVGSACHQRRVAFETNLRQTGNGDALRAFNQALAGLNLGRQVVAFAVAP